jgi:hypothetical protein
MRFLLAVSLLLAACSGASDDDAICAAASEHVAACVGEAVAPLSASCEGDVARQLLATPCDELTSRDSDGGKSDAQSNGGAFAVCVGLAVPIFVTGEQEGALCCFDYNCEGALVCRSAVCRKKSPRGGACVRVNHCQRGLGCFNETCQPPRTAGQTCDKDDACASDLICGADGKCVAPAQAGTTCTRDAECDSGRCHLEKCANEVREGQVCNDTNVCRIGLACTDGRCADRPASGGACYRDQFSDCNSGETCWEGTCEPQHQVGEACESMFDCEFGLFCRSAKCETFD